MLSPLTLLLASFSCPAHDIPRPAFYLSRAKLTAQNSKATLQRFPRAPDSRLLIFKKSQLDGKPQWLLQLLLKQPRTKCARALGQMCILLKLAAGHSTDQWEIITGRLKCSEM